MKKLLSRSIEAVAIRVSKYLALCAALVVAAIPGTATADEVRVLKFAQFAPPTSDLAPLYRDVAEDYAKSSGGTLKLEMHWGSSMGPTPRLYHLVRDGVADMSFYHPALTPDLFPLHQVLHTSYLVPNPMVGARVAMSLVPKYLEKEHKGVKILSFLATDPDWLYTSKKPVRTLADLRGLRIRVASRSAGKLLAQAGAVPVNIPPTEMAEALQRGTIDGIITSAAGLHQFRLGELLKYRSPLIGGVNTFPWAINQKVYDELTPKHRTIVDRRSGMSETIKTAQIWMTARETYWADYLKSSKIEDVEISPELDQRMRQLAAQETEELLQSLESKGLPARSFYAEAKALAAKYAKQN
jgi:TRAP-type C4-dicarboxylate transport system substrate-binding protein